MTITVPSCLSPRATISLFSFSVISVGSKARALETTSELWDLFIECLHGSGARRTFIVVDSIDNLSGGDTSDNADDRQIVMQKLDALVTDGKALIKILLTARLAHAEHSSTDLWEALTLP
jgi:hypothetical protein